MWRVGLSTSSVDLGWLSRCWEQLRDGRARGWLSPNPPLWSMNDLEEVAHLRHFRSFLNYLIATYCGLGSTWGSLGAQYWIKPRNKKHLMWLNQLEKTWLKSFRLWNWRLCLVWRIKRKGPLYLQNLSRRDCLGNIAWIHESSQMNEESLLQLREWNMLGMVLIISGKLACLLDRPTFYWFSSLMIWIL